MLISKEIISEWSEDVKLFYFSAQIFDVKIPIRRFFVKFYGFTSVETYKKFRANPSMGRYLDDATLTLSGSEFLLIEGKKWEEVCYELAVTKKDCKLYGGQIIPEPE